MHSTNNTGSRFISNSHHNSSDHVPETSLNDQKIGDFSELKEAVGQDSELGIHQKLETEKKSNQTLYAQFIRAKAQAAYKERTDQEADDTAEISSQGADLHTIKNSVLEEITLIPYTFKNQNWEGVTSVVLASGGNQGAWFYVNPRQGSVVVKSQQGLEKQLMGTVFLRTMGLDAPDAKIVDCNSEEGKTISKKSETLGPKGAGVRQLDDTNPAQYLVMDRVKGSNYGELNAANPLEELEKKVDMIEANLERIGELIIYDLTLGNFDRLNLQDKAFNAGNIMFEKGVLRPIDTDCQEPTPDRAAFTKQVFTKIFEKNNIFYAKKAVSMLEENFVDQLLGPFKSEAEALFTDEFPEKILQGMHAAKNKLLTFQENLDVNKKNFEKDCQTRGLKEASFPRYVADCIQYLTDIKLQSKS